MSKNRITRRQFSTATLAAAAGALAMPQFARAQQNYPSRPVRFVLPFGAGRRCRHHGTARGREARRQARPALRSRKSAGTGRHRRGARRALAAGRRLHHRARHQRHLDQRRDLQSTAVRSGEGIRLHLDHRIFRAGVLHQPDIPSSKRCRTSSRRRARSPASSTSAPSMSAARRISRPNCSSRRPGSTSRSFPIATPRRSSSQRCATTCSSWSTSTRR